MRTGLLLALALATCCAGAQEVEWSMGIDGPGSAPTLYPNEQNPTGVAFTSGKSIFLVDGIGAAVWKRDFDEFTASPVTVADLDGDGRHELLALVGNGRVVCLQQDGQPRWELPFRTPSGGFKHIVAADVTESTGLELLIGFDDGWLNCIGADGTLLWRFFGDKGRVGGIATADVDGDGAPEIVYGTDNGHIYCLTGSGRVQWRYDELAPYGRSGPNIADANDDGKPELYITRSNVGNATCIMALDASSGAYLWRSKDIQQGYVSNAFADIDGDGKLEIFHGDKGNFLYCENADGTRRWQAELGGRGLFWAPAIADIDGDGALEVMAGMRGVDHASGGSVFVLGADGSVESTLKVGSGANAAPAVGDIDGDGQLELTVMSEGPNQILCYSWKRAGRVAWPSVRGGSSMTANHNVSLGQPKDEPTDTPMDPRVSEQRIGYWGENVWAAPVGNGVGKSFFETAVHGEQGPAEIVITEPKYGADEIEIHWNYRHGARATIEMREFIDGASRYIVHATVTPKAPDSFGVDGLETGVHHTIASREAQGMDTALLESRLSMLRAEQQRLRDHASTSGDPDVLATAATALRKHAVALDRLRQSLDKGQTALPFLCWQDDNPWDAFDPNYVESTRTDTDPVVVTAFQDEFEDVALTLFNVTAQSIDLRCQFFEPMIATNRPPGDPAESQRVTLRRLVPVQTGAGATIWDPIPELDQSRSLTVPAGEARQLWLTIDTHGLAPGTHTLTLYLTTLGITPYMHKVPIELVVWPVALPKDVFLKMNWSNFNPGETSDQAVCDMLEHGISVIYGPPLPTIQVNELGQRAATVDWTAFDVAMQRIPRHFFLLWGGFAPLQWPGDAPAEGSDLHIAGIRTAIHEMNAHLAPLGFTYDRWAFYPMDEPWNTGFEGIPQLKAFCERIKKAEPQAQVYADPTGATRVEYVAEFKDLIDVWQPEINIVKRDPALATWFQENSKHFWVYEATGPAKELLPLGYYRAYAWLAWALGAEGAGYWVYRGEDTWWPLTGGDWSAVYQSNEFVVPSRRWQADRDGVEDFRALHVLRAEAKKARESGRSADADAAEALLAEAVRDVVGWQIGTIDEITRGTRAYELDFALLLDYRKKIAEAIMKLRGQ